jgi:hypothetical protein
MAIGRLITLGLKLSRGPLPLTCRRQFRIGNSRRYISSSHLRQFSAFPASHTMSRSSETSSFNASSFITLVGYEMTLTVFFDGIVQSHHDADQGSQGIVAFL